MSCNILTKFPSCDLISNDESYKDRCALVLSMSLSSHLFRITSALNIVKPFNIVVTNLLCCCTQCYAVFLWDKTKTQISSYCFCHQEVIPLMILLD